MAPWRPLPAGRPAQLLVDPSCLVLSSILERLVGAFLDTRFGTNPVSIKGLPRVNWLTIHTDFEVEVGRCGLSCVTHRPDLLPGGDLLSLADRQLAGVGVKGGDAIAVVHFHRVAVAAALARAAHHARRGRQDGRPFAGAQVHAGVAVTLAGQRMDALAVVAGDRGPARDHPGRSAMVAMTAMIMTMIVILCGALDRRRARPRGEPRRQLLERQA